MEIIKRGVKIRLTCEEEEAFVKVIEVLEEVGQDSEGNEFGYNATGGTHTSSLCIMLNDFFQECD